jgi:hypothetical protein
MKDSRREVANSIIAAVHLQYLQVTNFILTGESCGWKFTEVAATERTLS